jgi:probable phosphoglycerate mutase
VASKVAALHPDAIYSSPLRRAWETATTISEATGLPVKPEPRLKEIKQGRWQGMLVTDIRRKFPEEFRKWMERPWELEMPDRESLRDLEKRVLEAVEEIVERHPDETVVLVTHKLPIAIVKIHYAGVPRERIWDIIPPNADIDIVEVQPAERIGGLSGRVSR